MNNSGKTENDGDNKEFEFSFICTKRAYQTMYSTRISWLSVDAFNNNSCYILVKMSIGNQEIEKYHPK